MIFLEVIKCIPCVSVCSISGQPYSSFFMLQQLQSIVLVHKTCNVKGGLVSLSCFMNYLLELCACIVIQVFNAAFTRNRNAYREVQVIVSDSADSFIAVRNKVAIGVIAVVCRIAVQIIAIVLVRFFKIGKRSIGVIGSITHVLQLIA